MRLAEETGRKKRLEARAWMAQASRRQRLKNPGSLLGTCTAAPRPRVVVVCRE